MNASMKLAISVVCCLIATPLLLANDKLTCSARGELIDTQIVKPSLRSGKESVNYTVTHNVSGSKYYLLSYYFPSSPKQRYWSELDKKIASDWFQKNIIGAQTTVEYHCWFPRIATSGLDSEKSWRSQARLNIFIYMFLTILFSSGLYFLIKRVYKLKTK
jgi:hypothetical protein